MKLNWFEKLIINSPIRLRTQQKEARLLLQLGGNISGGKVLEIGCGRGAGIEIIFDIFNPSYVEAFDVDPDQIRLAKRRLLDKYQEKVKLYIGSATEIPSPNSYFDAVFDFGVLHHIPDSALAIGEIARVLKPKGRFFFMELLSSYTMRPIVHFFTQHQPETQFTWEELTTRIAKSGLTVSETSFVLGSGRVVGVARKSA